MSSPTSTRGAIAPPRHGWVDITTFLAHAVAATREHGYVAAAATGEEPTWCAALDRLTRGADLGAGDLRRSHQILGWAASLRPRRPDGYRARLAACLAHERLGTADLPLAASAVRAFNLHLYYEIRGRRTPSRPAGDP
jgi:hypothetical protein